MARSSVIQAAARVLSTAGVRRGDGQDRRCRRVGRWGRDDQLVDLRRDDGADPKRGTLGIATRQVGAGRKGQSRGRWADRQREPEQQRREQQRERETGAEGDGADEHEEHGHTERREGGPRIAHHWSSAPSSHGGLRAGDGTPSRVPS